VRKLIESTLISLDGVIGSPERWSPFGEEAAQLAMEDLGNYDGFVMGRVTYERFRADWAPVSGNPYIDRINAMPKYVASRTLGEVTWNATLLGPDIVGDIERLKAQPGKDLIKYGTSRLDDDLAQDGPAALQKGVVYRYDVIATCRACTATRCAWDCAMAGRTRGS
jgi:dihydrofolate reductase